MFLSCLSTLIEAIDLDTRCLNLKTEYCLLASFDERYFQQSLIFQLVLFFMFVYLFYNVYKMEIKQTQTRFGLQAKLSVYPHNIIFNMSATYMNTCIKRIY